MFKSTPDQWLLLNSLVELGSLAKAAKAHNRSQPAVSYQLQQLQEQLGVELLSLSGRQLILTDTGHELLEQANVLLEGWSRLEQRAQALAKGERSVISLVIDSIFPKHWLSSALKQFNHRYPQIQVHVKEVVRDESQLQIEQQIGDLYLVSLPEVTDYEKQWVMDIRFLLVASAQHPIFATRESLRHNQLDQYPLIQVIDKEQQQENKFKPAYRESWYFTSIESAIEAVRSQLGYGWLPARNIQRFLKSGELKPVDMTQFPPRLTRLYLTYKTETRHDPVLNALHEALLSSARHDDVAHSMDGNN